MADRDWTTPEGLAELETTVAEMVGEEHCYAAEGDGCGFCEPRTTTLLEALPQILVALRDERERHARLQAMVDQQAEDPALWFLVATAAEGYLQQELRKLHAAIEG